MKNTRLLVLFVITALFVRRLNIRLKWKLISGIISTQFCVLFYKRQPSIKTLIPYLVVLQGVFLAGSLSVINHKMG